MEVEVMGTQKLTYNNIQGRKGSQFRDQLRGLNLEQVLFIPIDAAIVLGACHSSDYVIFCRRNLS